VPLVVESSDVSSDERPRTEKLVYPPFMYLGWRREDLPIPETRTEHELVTRAIGREGVS
jgi:hypothetical protein